MTMKKIIDGITYDTDTATKICFGRPSLCVVLTLYRTPSRHYFYYGELHYIYHLQWIEPVSLKNAIGFASEHMSTVEFELIFND